MGLYRHAMNSKPYFKSQPDGSVCVTPAPPDTASRGYAARPVQVAVRREPLGLEIHGENFSSEIDLSTFDALDVCMMILYGVREAAPVPCEFVEVTS
jgi:hypothetical protein